MAKGSAADTAGTAVKGYFDPSGYIASTAVRVFSGKDRTKPPSRRQREQLIAAGYTVGLQRIGRGAGVEVFTSPQGRILGPDSARIAAKRLPTPPIAPQPQLPTGSDIFEELLKRPARTPSTPPLDPDFERLLKRGPQSDFERLMDRPLRTPADTPPKGKKFVRVAGRAARILGRVGGIIGGVLYPSETASDDVLYPPGTAMPLPQPDGPRGPPRRPVRNREPRDRPKLPAPFPQSIPDRTGQPRAPSQGSPAPWPIVLLPVPGKQPQPTRPPLPSAPPTTANPVDLLTIPLPNPQFVPLVPSPVVSPAPAIPKPPNPRTTDARAPTPLTMPQPNPLGSLYREPPDRCSCPPRTKRKPSKPRTVCYTGSYREKSRGLSKTPRRKIPCL